MTASNLSIWNRCADDAQSSVTQLPSLGFFSG